jgi:hypothetical protein
MIRPEPFKKGSGLFLFIFRAKKPILVFYKSIPKFHYARGIKGG